jgi:hypothetical protein
MCIFWVFSNFKITFPIVFEGMFSIIANVRYTSKFLFFKLSLNYGMFEDFFFWWSNSPS